MTSNKKRTSRTALLVALCWLVYTASYLGKLGYSANITEIERVYGVTHASAGMVSTFFFFAYGVGQIINGILCKRYNLRQIVFVSLMISGLMNCLVGITPSFALIKYFWLVNGAALSVLWASLVRLLSENLDECDINRTIIILGTTVPAGTLIVYGLSALLVALDCYVLIFYIAAILLPPVALLWFFSYPSLVKSTGANVEVEISGAGQLHNSPISGKLWDSICVLAFFAIAVNLVKDGLTTWVPMILKETYALPNYMSILSTLLLPILALFGTAVAIRLNKKIKDLVFLSAVMFFMSALLIGAVILCLPTGLVAVTLASFALVSCLMSGINNIITSMAPLYWKENINPGLLAGVFNGFCYAGSTVSAYGLGAIADRGGWEAVIWLLFGLCAFAVALGGVCFTLGKVRGRSSIASN